MQGYEENLLLLLENIKKQVPDNDIMPVWLAGYQIQACINALRTKAKLEKFIEGGSNEGMD